VDRETLSMTCRVMQHTSFRARQVRDGMVDRAASLLLEYVDAMGNPHLCETAVLDLHFEAIRTLLTAPADATDRGAALISRLNATVKQKIARRPKAA
jgi:hypothetical protein